MRIFVAGATGVIGSRLVPLLLEAGHEVTGTTRSEQRAAQASPPGLTMVVMDAFDAAATRAAVAAAAPEVVIHQMTDLTGLHQDMSDALARNSRLRSEGTRHLVDATAQAGVRRIVAQSIAWIYAPGPRPHHEGDPLFSDAAGAARATIDGVVSLEEAVLGVNGVEGLILRYGWIYGASAGSSKPHGECPLHVDAAALAALLACSRGGPGIYNVAEPNPTVSSAKATEALGWSADFRCGR